MADPRIAYLVLDLAGTACALPREAAAEILPLPELQAAPASGAGWPDSSTSAGVPCR
ncbi:hypothetical protein ACFQFG_21330 [Methylobacterium persicinum]